MRLYPERSTTDRSAPCRIESLEPRALLSFQIIGDTLFITGTTGADDIYVDPNSDTDFSLRINASSHLIPFVSNGGFPLTRRSP